MHVGALVVFEGPPPTREEFCAHIESRLRSCRATGRSSRSRASRWGGPFWVDDPNFNLDYHVRHTALPTPGSEDQLRQLAGPHLLPAARPLEAALGDLGRPGPRGRPLRADLEDPPRARGRRVGRGHRDRAVRPLARAGRGRRRTTAGPRRPSPRDVDLVAEGVKGLVRTPFELAGRAVGALSSPGHTLERVREAAEGLGEVVWAGHEPGARRAAQRADRPAPPRALGAEPAGRLQGDQERARRHRQRRRARRGRRARCGAGCATAACAREGARAARARARVDPRARTNAGRARQPHRRDARPAAGVRRATRSSGCGSCARGWDA